MRLGYRIENSLNPLELWYDKKLPEYFIIPSLLEKNYLNKVLGVFDKLEIMRILYQYNRPNLKDWFGYYKSDDEYPDLYNFIKSRGKNPNWNNISNRVQYYYFGKCQKLNHSEILINLPLKIILEMKEQSSIENGSDSDCRGIFILVMKEFEKGFKSLKSRSIDKLSELPDDLIWIRDVLNLSRDKYWNYLFLSELSKYIHWYMIDISKSDSEMARSVVNACINY